MTDTVLDPRPAYSAATAWVQSPLEGLTADQLGRPTPCGELDVRALAGHLTAHCLQVTASWGPASGAEALATYVNEALVHGWDIAVATGQSAEIPDGAVAAAALDTARVAIPAELRTVPGFPFGPVVEPRDAAGPTERLANWNGCSAIGRRA